MDDQPLPDPPCECEECRPDLALDRVMGDEWRKIRRAHAYFTQAPGAQQADWS